MGKKVLFVDDEADWRLVATTCLKDAGYEVITASNGTDALLVSDGIKLDVIILDVNLAGENGTVFIEFLKRNHPGVPIILYTGMQHDEKAIQAMLQKGARKYLRKGSMEELLQAVQNP